jgi:hypothetical protein
MKLGASARVRVEKKKKRINAENAEDAEFTEKRITGLKTRHYTSEMTGDGRPRKAVPTEEDRQRGVQGYGFLGLGGSNCMVRTMPSPSLTKST